MSAETLVRDEVTMYGQHWLEVLRMGAPVDRDAWMDRVPVGARHLMKSWERHEKEMDIYRYYLWWPVRELVRVKLDGTVKEVVVWFIEPGQTIRNAAINAAAEMWLERERWPEMLWLWHVPDGAPKRVPLDVPEVELEVQEAVWAPKGYVVVGWR